MMTPQQLKNSILQRAIEGKLVEQRPEEGTAKELLKQIKAEKDRLIKEGKIKKTKPLLPITEDEIPFEIPESWEWCYLNDVAFITKLAGFEYSKYISPNLALNGIPIFKGKNIQNGTIVESFEGYIPETISDELFRSQLTKKCLLTPYVGTIGNIAIFEGKYKAHLGSNVGKIELFNEDGMHVLEEFVLFYLRSNTGYRELTKYKKATAQESISIDAIRNVVIPLPPLAEQHRIVAKIEELMPFVDEYDKAYSQLVALNEKFPADMKKSILQYAIEGKLVEQRPEEGTAADLLKQIKAEKAKLVKEGKIKKEKPLPPITEEEIPFDIPESWVWCRLGDISNYAQPKVKIKPCDIQENIWSLDLEDIEKDTGRILNKVYSTDRKIKGEKVAFSKGNILYSKLRPYLRKILIATDDGITSPEIIPFNIYGEVHQSFFMWFLKSNYVDSVVNEASYGVKMPRVGTETMLNLLIALPPLAEQKRIVSKLEQILPFADELILDID